MADRRDCEGQLVDTPAVIDAGAGRGRQSEGLQVVGFIDIIRLFVRC
jgi:hypothetical protein